MTQDILHELFVEQIRDIYDAEKQLVKALPKLVKAADSEPLAKTIRSHFEETKEHVARLEQIFGLLGVTPKGSPCQGMKGLIQEGSEATEAEEGRLRDLAIIAGAQRVEHYEISAYGTARTIAQQLGMRQAVDLLQRTETEESMADSKLTEVAMDLYQAEHHEPNREAPESGDSREPEMAGKRGSGNSAAEHTSSHRSAR